MTQENPIYQARAERTDRSVNINSALKSESRIAQEINEYEKLSNEELAKLVAEIRKEFNPKADVEMLRTQSPIVTPSKPTGQLESAAKKIEPRTIETNAFQPASDSKNHDINPVSSLRKDFSSDLVSFDAKVSELKKDLQNFFSQ